MISGSSERAGPAGEEVRSCRFAEGRLSGVDGRLVIMVSMFGTGEVNRSRTGGRFFTTFQQLTVTTLCSPQLCNVIETQHSYKRARILRLKYAWRQDL